MFALGNGLCGAGLPRRGRCGGSVGAGGAGRASGGALRWRAWVGFVAGTPLCCEIPKLELYKPRLWIWLAQFLQLATPAFYSLRGVQASDACLRKNPFPVRPWLAEGLRSAAPAPGSAGRGAAPLPPAAPRCRGRGARAPRAQPPLPCGQARAVLEASALLAGLLRALRSL